MHAEIVVPCKQLTAVQSVDWVTPLRQYDFEAHACLVYGFTQKLPAGHGRFSTEPSGQ